MDKELWTAVDHYIDGLVVGPDPILDDVLAACNEAGLPPIQVSPSQGKLGMLLAVACRARRILEIGTLGGYSTIWLARALPPDGQLVTLEIDPKHAEVARRNFARAGVSHLIELREGAASDSLARLVSEKTAPFDFIFIDADKERYPEYFTLSLQLAHRGTMMIADNIVRDGKVKDDASDDDQVTGVRRFLDLIAAEPTVSGTVVQTVGSKGYDGFAVVVVTADRPISAPEAQK
jgi:predicted O-methyltransferase YrrM